MTRLVAERDQTHMRPAPNERGTKIRLTAGKAQAGETNLNLGWLGHVRGPVAPPGSAGTDQIPVERGIAFDALIKRSSSSHLR